MARVISTCIDVMDRQWEWGRADCCTAACDVFLRLYGIDPMNPLRGKYDSRLGALRIIASSGGMLEMAEGLAAKSGLLRSTGQVGDIGVIVTEGQLALGICAGKSWLGKSETGMSSASQFLKAWSCPR